MASMPDIISSVLPAEEVSILAGASGVGKTTLIMTVLKDLQEGREVFGNPVLPSAKIGYIAADRTWESYVKTAALTGLDLSRISIRTLIDDAKINLADFEKDPMATLQGLIRSMLPLDLVVVDPLVVFLGVDTNKDHLNAARLIALNRFCRANKVTILGTHHATKARSDYSFKRAQDRISGTSALLGFTSTQLFLAAPEETGREDGCHEWHIISHHAPGRVICLRRVDGLFELVETVTANNEPLDERILQFVASFDYAIPRKMIMDAVVDENYGPSTPTVDRKLAHLVRESLLVKEDTGMYYIRQSG